MKIHALLNNVFFHHTYKSELRAPWTKGSPNILELHEKVTKFFGLVHNLTEKRTSMRIRIYFFIYLKLFVTNYMH